MSRIRNSKTKEKLLQAGVKLMLAQGFNATSVDEICQEAGVTKGSFFHYFETKEELAKEAVNHFSNCRIQQFEAGSYNSLPDPLDRLYGYLDFMIADLKNPESPKSCLIGTLTQELSQTHSELRSVCDQNFSWHNRRLQSLIEEAVKAHPPKSEMNPASLAKCFNAIYQGSIILKKASQESSLIAENILHFKKYLQTLFQ